MDSWAAFRTAWLKALILVVRFCLLLLIFCVN